MLTEVGTFLALILNFSTVGHGGRMGEGVRLIFQFWRKKNTFSRLHEGHSWGGRMGGAEMEGWMGGRLLA